MSRKWKRWNRKVNSSIVNGYINTADGCDFDGWKKCGGKWPRREPNKKRVWLRQIRGCSSLCGILLQDCGICNTRRWFCFSSFVTIDRSSSGKRIFCFGVALLSSAALFLLLKTSEPPCVPQPVARIINETHRTVHLLLLRYQKGQQRHWVGVIARPFFTRPAGGRDL